MLVAPSYNCSSLQMSVHLSLVLPLTSLLSCLSPVPCSTLTFLLSLLSLIPLSLRCFSTVQNSLSLLSLIPCSLPYFSPVLASLVSCSPVLASTSTFFSPYFSPVLASNAFTSFFLKKKFYILHSARYSSQYWLQ